MSRRLILLASVTVLLAALPVQASSELVDHLYGRGAHAYYASDFVKAHELMTAAIEGASNDPRVYYFRGLAYLKLGRPEQARIDFQMGSRIEMADSNAFYNVSKALERIQGNDRLEIEKYRSEARVAAMKRAKAILHARYEKIRSQEGRVLRKSVNLTPQAVDTSAGPSKASADDFEDTSTPAKSSQESEEADPFSDDDPFGTAPPKKKMQAEKAPAEKATETDPFGGDDDPFGSTPPKKEEPVKKAPAAAPSDDDPFASPPPKKEEPVKKAPAAAPSDDDPFASPPPKKEEPAKKAPAAAPSDDDPFASPPPKKEEPAKKAPAAAPSDGDPFASPPSKKEEPAKKTPAAAPSDGDPFTSAPAKKEEPAQKALAEKAPAKAAPEADPFGDKDPFSGARQPAIEPREKTAARSPVTKPATSPGPVAVRPAASPQPLPKSAKAIPEMPGPTDPLANKPEKDNPFIEEPITAGNE